MTLTLRPEHERVIADAISASLIRTPDEVVDLGIATIRQNLESRQVSRRQEDIDSAAERLRKFGEKYRLSLGELSIKDLIEDGRR